MTSVQSHFMRKKKRIYGINIDYTQSAGSTEFPFKSLWFSSLVLLSLSLVLNGNKKEAPPVRSGSSAFNNLKSV
jgi:hypothetical protein